MSRILVTGASGFVGRQVLPLLVDGGHQVFAVARSPRPEASRQVGWIAADLLQVGEAARVLGEAQPEQLLHLAWCVQPGEFWFSADNSAWLRASLELVEGFCRQGGSRAVVVGSCAEYDWCGAVNPCRENATPIWPRTLYGASKHALHLLLATSPRTSALSLAWARLFHLYGPFEPAGKIVGDAIRSLRQGQALICRTNGEQIRDFLHVQEAAAALVALLHSGVTGPVNIASGCPMSLRELLAGAAAELRAPGLLGFGERREEPAALTAAVERLGREVGWKPSRDVEAGMRDTVAWWTRQAENEALGV